MTIAEEIRSIGEELAAVSGNSFTKRLTQAIERFVGWPYKITSSRIRDVNGTKTDIIDIVVYACGDQTVDPSESVPADNVAAIVVVLEVINPESLRDAYERVRSAKRLRKAVGPDLKGAASTTATLGIIFAQRSAVGLDELAKEVERLNSGSPSREWPDVIGVADIGVLNYAVQFPGSSLSGDYMPPSEGAFTKANPAAFYVVAVMRPTGPHTLNKVMALLVGHLAIFSPGAKVPNFIQILEGVPKTAVTLPGYQYNLSGELAPVPREFYRDRLLPTLPLRIETKNGQLLSTIQFLPWQDGGVILLRGKLPLDGIMVFLDQQVFRRAGVLRPDSDLQISYVLPITAKDFEEMLRRFQRQSNMVVRLAKEKFVVQKMSDEGATSPYIARLFMGILRLRDLVYLEERDRDKFDNLFEAVSSQLTDARTAVREIISVWEIHAAQVSAGDIARVEAQAIHINENIDKPLRQLVEGFLNSAVRALKHGMQSLATELRTDIGFLFKKQNTFDNGIAALRLRDPLLADYLLQVRSWSEPLITARNDIEHTGWTLPRVTYRETNGSVLANEPEVRGRPVSDFVAVSLDRLCCFVEEVTVHCLQQKMTSEISIAEIPIGDRIPEAPERFRVTVVAGGSPRWELSYHDAKFEDV